MARPDANEIRTALTDPDLALADKVKKVNGWLDAEREEAYNEGSRDGYDEGYAAAEEDNDDD